jgi:serine/threonine-protein kinase RIM15
MTQVDIILMEFKLPQINGEDVARMIRTSKNPNSSTPIVAVTGYLKDLSDPQHFDELMEKPATPSKLIDVLERQCFWKAPASDRPAFGDRKDLLSIRAPLDVSDERGRLSPSVERFMASARSRSAASPFSLVDDDAVSVASSTDPTRPSRTSDWERLNLSSGLPSEHEMLGPNSMSNMPPPVGIPIPHQEMGPVRLQSHPMERIPSPLSTHVSAGMLDNITPPLPSPPDLASLAPSVHSEPLFGTQDTEMLKSADGNVPPVVPLQRFRTHPPAANSLEEGFAHRHMRPQRFNMLFSPSKDMELSDQDDEQSVSPPLDFNKNKSKRSSLEKKKEKQGKLRKEGLLGEEADADDEDSLSGGRRPSKSRSIGEIIRGVKRSPPEMKRTKSSEGRR